MKFLQIYLRLHNLRQKFAFIMDGLNSAFWLGVFNTEKLHLLDNHYYQHWDMYQSEEHNMRGFYKWEEGYIEKYFTELDSVLVPGAGSGREVIALATRGKHVRGFECNSVLLERGKYFLEKSALDASLELAPRDNCPATGKKWDGCLVGWSAYMHIPGKINRVNFLKQVAQNLNEAAPVMLSFFVRSEEDKSFKWIAVAGGIIAGIFKNTPGPQKGDLLSPNFIHYFTENELREELELAGMELLEFANPGPGVAIARKI